MSTITNLTIAPEGMSALRCPVCEAFLTFAQEKHVETNQSVDCLECGEPMFRWMMDAAVRFTDADLLNSESVSEQVWYHATTRKHWMDNLLAASDTPWVHVGSMDAAYDRARVGGTGEIVEDHFLYTLRLKPEATVNAHIFRDENDWPDSVGQVALGLDERLNDADANRYLNSFEAPGSISLLVDPRALQITSVLMITATIKKAAWLKAIPNLGTAFSHTKHQSF